jgi:hypothetical protein
MRLRRSVGFLVSALLLSGCSALSLLDTPSRNHISVANRSDYDVSLTPDGRTLRVSLDDKSALGRRLAWAASFGTADGPPSSEFDTAAADWLKFDKPGCTASNGRRVEFGTSEYDVTCESVQAGR